MDDGRQGSTAFRLGSVYNEDKKKFEICEIQKKRDIEMKEPNNVRLARWCLVAMNSINPDLTFTT